MAAGDGFGFQVVDESAEPAAAGLRGQGAGGEDGGRDGGEEKTGELLLSQNITTSKRRSILLIWWSNMQF